MNLNQLMRENVLEPDYVEYQPSKRLIDENGDAQTWLFRPLTNKEYDRINARHTKKIKSKTGNVLGEELDSHAVLADMVLESLVEPSKADFEQKELQDSWGVFSPIEVIKAMLQPGEYADLLVKVQQLAGFEISAVEDARAETEKN